MADDLGEESGRPPESTLDPARVAALYVDHGQELRRFVLGVVRDADLAADVVQAAFVKCLERGHEARAESLKGWLFRVAYHEALAARRRQATRDSALPRLASRTHASHRPEEGLVRGEVAESVRKVLETLPYEQRFIVMARIQEDKTFAAIAREHGLPLGTVLTRMRRALARLRTALGPEIGD